MRRRFRRSRHFIRNFGLHIHVGNSQEVRFIPKKLQKLLAKIEDSPEEAMICRLALRSMKRAGYSPRCIRGILAWQPSITTSFYFPDPRVSGSARSTGSSRTILRGRMTDGKAGALCRQSFRMMWPAQASETERRADEAEREADQD